ncbi:hypothetical protein [Zunongwangia profunda]|uniref:hypothetical protein n=1 Tax=Zunongwangia profunda TaxID=398743 RepID=UPI001D195EC1|nr:hypothetical protein [Zunongwangia profunda]MCC4228377.1 hypothetical protein [Zunongwangia profunda]
MNRLKLKTWLSEFFSNIGQLLLSLLLIIVALALFLPCLAASIIWKVIVSITKENRKARDIISGTKQFFLAIAIALDQLGNVAFGGFFNWLFLKDQDGLYNFGAAHETISEVLGWNLYLDHLNQKGKYMVALLDWIESDHCIKAMRSGIETAQFKADHWQNVQEYQVNSKL